MKAWFNICCEDDPIVYYCLCDDKFTAYVYAGTTIQSLFNLWHKTSIDYLDKYESKHIGKLQLSFEDLKQYIYEGKTNDL